LPQDEDFIAKGRTLAELDEGVRRKLKNKIGNRDSVVKVNMSFDYMTIPLWIRQYTSYYLHRVIY